MKHKGVSTRLIVVIACIAMIVVLGVAAVIIAITSDTGDMASREEIESSMADLGDGDLGHRYVANHLLEYGFGGFDAGKLRNVEYYFTTNYPGELDSVPKLAYKTAELFMQYYYDRLDMSDRDAVTTAIVHCFVEATGDRYAVYRTPEELEDFTVDMSGTFVGIGVSVMQSLDPATGKLAEVYVEDVINDSGADDAGILHGDYIIAVDGTPITEHDRSSLVNAIRGEKGTTVSITVLRGTEEIVFVCERRQVVDRTVTYSVEGSIGYIEITSFKDNTPDLFREALSYVYSMDVDGIIFDLRDNPGGYLSAVIDVIDMLVPADKRIVSYVDKNGAETTYNSTGNGTALPVPAVVICNENTASAGELFTSALRDYNDMGILKATIVGKTTYGKGVMQSTFPFLDGSSITLTVAHYNPPSGENYEGIGIVPDVAVDDLEGNTDEQLLRALEILTTPTSGGSNSQM